MGRLELVLLGLTCCLAVAGAAKLGAVYTEGGFVEGVNKKLSLLGGDSVDIFKGIPYATAKTLENPQRHPGWQGTLKATDFKKRCLQATITQDNSYGDEDCLYLNIWVPQGKKQVSQNLPVMIWIYGGAFLMGAGHGANFLSNYLYDGQEIATRGNVIVVTFNYRVGPLGFLSTGDANLPGNYGLRDQHMAIAWVKRNIAAFGGDPDNITIFGESAGGASVSLQTLSPYNKGLIRRAISQSGVALSPWVIQNDPLFWAKKVAKKVGCPLDDTARLARCLKVTDPRALTMAFKVPLAGLEYPVLHYLAFVPVIDGDFIPEDPVHLFANAADIDYLAGTNNMDGHLFAGVDLPAINKNNQDITEEDFYRLVSGLTVTKGLRGAQATFNVYTEPWAQDSSQETRKKTVVDLETDILFLMPTEIALAQHRANAKSAHTYSYLFSHPSRMPVYPKWVGADHADDLQYIFGKPFATPLGYRPQDRTVSKAMIAYWTNFARSGDPNMGHSAVPTHWYPYTLEDGNYLEITKKMDSSSMKQHLRTRYLKYWTQTYQALPTVVGEGTAPESPANDSLPPLVPLVKGSRPPQRPPVHGSRPPQRPPVNGSRPPQRPPVNGSRPPPAPPVNGSLVPPAPPVNGSRPPQRPPVNGSLVPPAPPVNGSLVPPAPPVNGSLVPPVPPVNGSLPPLAPPVNGSLPPLAPPVNGSLVPPAPPVNGSLVPPVPPVNGSLPPLAPPVNGSLPPLAPPVNGSLVPPAPPVNGSLVPPAPPVNGSLASPAPPVNGSRPPQRPPVHGSRPPLAPPVNGSLPPLAPPVNGSLVPPAPPVNGSLVPPAPPVNGSLASPAPPVNGSRPPQRPPVHGSRPPLAPPVNGSLVPPAPPVNGSLPPLAPPVNGSLVPPAPPVNGSLASPAPPVNGSLPPLAPPVNGSLVPPVPPVNGSLPPLAPPVNGSLVPPAPPVNGSLVPPAPPVNGSLVPPAPPVNGSLPPLAPPVNGSLVPPAPPVNGSLVPPAPPVHGSRPPLAPPVNGSLASPAPPVNGSLPPLAPPVNGSLVPPAPPVNGSLPPLAPPVNGSLVPPAPPVNGSLVPPVPPVNGSLVSPAPPVNGSRPPQRPPVHGSRPPLAPPVNGSRPPQRPRVHGSRPPLAPPVNGSLASPSGPHQ